MKKGHKCGNFTCGHFTV